jgi:hypothetical protein
VRLRWRSLSPALAAQLKAAVVEEDIAVVETKLGGRR